MLDKPTFLPIESRRLPIIYKRNLPAMAGWDGFLSAEKKLYSFLEDEAMEKNVFVRS